MDNKTNGILMKSCSASSCIKKGYQFYTKDFKKIVKRTWVVAMLYSIVCSALFTILTVKSSKEVVILSTSLDVIKQTSFQTISAILPILGLIIIGGIFELSLYSLVIAFLNNGFKDVPILYKKKPSPIFIKMFIRALIALLSNILITVILGGIIFIGVHPLISKFLSVLNITIPTIAIGCFEFIILFVIMLPLAYIDMKYILQTNTSFWKLLLSDYICAMKHFGYIFIVMIVSLIFIGIAECILTLPALIMTIANYQAYIGILNGDAINMPNYIFYISAIVFFIAGFIQIYVKSSALYTSYYMYGSIETQEKERKSFNSSSTSI